MHPAAAKGYTWGTNGKQKFPPARLDKVALLNMTARGIQVLEAAPLIETVTNLAQSEPGAKDRAGEAAEGGNLPVSDHNGLVCSLEIVENDS